MKRRMACGTALLLACAGWAQPAQPLYENTSDFDLGYGGALVVPQINATTFINQALFNIYTGEFPFDTQSTLYFTNKTSGTMAGDPGFRFDFITNVTEVTSLRRPMAIFHNQGKISATTKLLISATNIFSPGPLSVGAQGLLRLEGDNVSLARSVVRAGLDPYLPDPDAYLGTDNGGTYYNPRGVTDAYWGTGTNSSLGTNGARFNLPLLGSQFGGQYFTPPYASTPYHQVLERSTYQGNRIVTNSYSLPSYLTDSYNKYTTYAISNWTSQTSSVIQIVFVPTNNATLSNGLITSSVRFGGGFSGETTPIVEFSAPYYDVVDQTNKVSAFYLIDNAASATNFGYSTGQNPDTFQATGTRRPNVYETATSEPYNWTFAIGPNIAYTNTMFYSTNFTTNVVTYRYAAYSAILNPPLTNSTTDTTGVYDPTNSVGRIEINAGQLDLRQARVKAENFLSIKTTNLVGNALAVVDAPVINYDLGSTNSVLPVSNLVAKTFNRLSGQVYAWSAVWTVDSAETNVFTGVLETNRIKYHIFFVDSFLTVQQPVRLNDFTARATNVVIYDPLQISKSITVDADSLRLAATGTNIGSITLPATASWMPANFPRLNYLTNEGAISFTGSGNFYRQLATNDIYGQPVTLEMPYLVLNNSGTITGASHTVRASNLVNSGTFIAASGNFDFHVTNATLAGGLLSARSDLHLSAANLDAVNSALTIGGSLLLDVTDRLSDGGVAANNVWTVADGFNLSQRPTTGDLLGTRIISTAAYNTLINHTWAGADRGVSVAGFSNNAALGRLVLDGQDLSLFHFAGSGTSNALYVDYLEFHNYATNIQAALAVETNLTIYFANANISPDKLNGALRGRLKWVYNYTGPNSTTNVLVDGRLVSMNTALMQSAFSDLDADGIPNKVDTTPLLSGSSLDVRVEYVRTPSLVARISWYAIKGSTSYLDYRTSLVGGDWVNLTTLVQSASNDRLTVVDPVGSGQQRFYRVRVVPVIGLAQP